MITSLLLSSFLAASAVSEPIDPQVVQEQLKDAEKEFQEAKKMFNPWYAGPLLTPSAHLLAPGKFNIQPYLFLTNSYARFSPSGASHKVDSLKTVNPQLVFQFGMLDWMDGIVIAQSVSNWKNGRGVTHFGDTTVGIGIKILEEQLYTPAVLISIRETFPTGKASNLSVTLEGADITGLGAYSTTVNLNVSKVVWWLLDHPMNLRGSLGYTFPSIAKVNGFHAHGGGFGTKGKIHTPNAVSLNGAFEYSFTQRWVFALDAVYSYAARSKFAGQAGFDAQGNKAVNGGDFSDNLSFAPALEYNPNANLGLLAGVWFSVWGRNSANFVSGIISFTYSF